MEVLDATSLAERLKWEGKEYWVHLKADSPLDKYPAKQHARRVQEKLRVEKGLIYLPGQPARNNDDSDMPAPFRQLRYFYYLSGCNEPGCHLAYDIRHDKLALFIPRIDPNRVIWNGRGSNRAEALDKYDVDEVYYVDQLPAFVQKWSSDACNQRSDLYVLHEDQVPPSSVNLERRVDSISLQPAMNLSRMVKDDHEISLVRKANDISSQAHREVLANILNFKNEAQVQGLFVNVCISQQAKEQAYDPIAASGPNAGTLHYDANNEDFADRQLMCLDAGCEFDLYASDITRTFPLSTSWPTKEAENVYKLVQRMQEACIEELAPGVRYLDLHIKAHHIAIDGLLRLGILHNGTKEEIYKAGTSRAFFPHGLGHHIGLEVHDVGQAELMSVRRGKPVYAQVPSLYPLNFHDPVYDSKTCHAPTDPHSSHLEEGMVVTVEPGIYFSVYALQHFYLPSPVHSKYINAEVVERYLPVGGVRIEDDILITSNGYENLTSAPKGEAMFKIIRSGNPNADAALDSSTVSRRRDHGVKQQLIRAPGIPTTMLEPINRPLARAATMPAEPKRRGSVDFEPFQGPSLFTNFKRSLTTDENIQRWQQSRDNVSTTPAPAPARKAFPVCGDSTINAQHIYLNNAHDLSISSHAQVDIKGQQKCQNCVVLVKALDRLRQHLPISPEGSPKPKQQSDIQLHVERAHFKQARYEVPTTRPRTVEDTVTKSVQPTEKCVNHILRQDNSLYNHSTNPFTLERVQTSPRNVLASCASTTLPLNAKPFILPLRPTHSHDASGCEKKEKRSTEDRAAPQLYTKRSPRRFASSNLLAEKTGFGGVAFLPIAPSKADDIPLESARKEIEILRQRLSSLENQAGLRAPHHEPASQLSLAAPKLDHNRQRHEQGKDARAKALFRTSQESSDAWKRATAREVQLGRRRQLEGEQSFKHEKRPSACLVCGPYCHCNISR